jgi:ABC-type uncharacterized transport system permease subunit
MMVRFLVIIIFMLIFGGIGFLLGNLINRKTEADLAWLTVILIMMGEAVGFFVYVYLFTYFSFIREWSEPW